MHCFIGLEVQQPLFNEVLDITHHWDGPPADFHKHTYPHVTLIPPFDIKNADELIQKLSAVTAEFPQFAMDYAAIGAFNRRIVHVAVESNGLVDLRAKLFEAGAGIFHYQEEHPVWHAHTTIAYVRDPLTQAAFDELKTKLETRLGLPQHQTVTSIQFYGRENPAHDYRTLANLPLNDNL